MPPGFVRPRIPRSKMHAILRGDGCPMFEFRVGELLLHVWAGDRRNGLERVLASVQCRAAPSHAPPTSAQNLARDAGLHPTDQCDIVGESDVGGQGPGTGRVEGLHHLVGQPPQFVIDAYHQLWRIEKAFRMSKHDLRARPIYHRTRDSIEAHLSVVFAAMAVGHWIEHQTGWSIKKFVRAARRCRTVTIQAGKHSLTVAEPPSPDLAEALAKIHDLRTH
jgi:hypothetical protein